MKLLNPLKMKWLARTLKMLHQPPLCKSLFVFDVTMCTLKEVKHVNVNDLQGGRESI